MASTKRRYSKEEFARRGDAVYETEVRPHLTAADEGKFAAIDIKTGTYEIDADELQACDRLRARAADAQIWLVRIGSRHVHRFGGREPRAAPAKEKVARQSLLKFAGKAKGLPGDSSRNLQHYLYGHPKQ